MKFPLSLKQKQKIHYCSLIVLGVLNGSIHLNFWLDSEYLETTLSITQEEQISAFREHTVSMTQGQDMRRPNVSKLAQEELMDAKLHL